jgi:signal transduction histidine kinase/CheY-like chemotaxis protein
MPKRKILIVSDDDERRDLLASILEAAGFPVVLGHENIAASDLAATVVAEANGQAVDEYKRLLEKLSGLGQTLGTAHDLSAIFAAILKFSIQLVPCSALLISLYDEAAETRRFIYFWYNNREVDVTALEAFPAGSGPSKQAIMSGEVTIINNYADLISNQTPLFSFGFDQDQRVPNSEIIAPLRLMGNTIGLIEVQSYEKDVYTEEHAVAMRMAATLVANAIENVRLSEQERRTEEQLRLVLRLDSVGRLAGGIAHDFNNMLTAINGYSDLTLRSLSDDDPLRRNLEEIKKAGERSATLTSQLLAFSRKQVLTPKIIDVNNSVNEMLLALEQLVGENIQLKIDFKPGLGLVKADPAQLSQVIVNLAVNAREAMPNGGELKVATANVFLDEAYVNTHVGSHSGNFVLLSVSDTGGGISEEQQEHIFEPFYTTKDKAKGTGLGLATVYGIVKQSGGHIWVDSQVGHGSTFNVYLPLIDEAATPEKPITSGVRPAGGGERLLLVDDEETVRNLAKQILVRCGYSVIAAEDADQALEILRRPDQQIDLLVTDVVMPKMSGPQLAENTLKIRPDIKVLYMSGYTDDAVFRKGITDRDRNFIKKPFTYASFSEKVREILDS